MVKYAEPDQGCNVCRTVLPPDGPGSYLRLETNDQTFGQVCSWLCATQFSVLKAAEQRNTLLAHIKELRRKNEDLKDDNRLLDYYRAGVL
jgi:hypothetical protein